MKVPQHPQLLKERTMYLLGYEHQVTPAMAVLCKGLDQHPYILRETLGTQTWRTLLRSRVT